MTRWDVSTNLPLKITVFLREENDRFFRLLNNECILSVLFAKTHVERIFTPLPIRVKDLRKFFSPQWDRRGTPPRKC